MDEVTGSQCNTSTPIKSDSTNLKNKNKCFVCDQVLVRATYSLAKSITKTTKTFIAQKLGDIVGERYIVVVCEDDYICQNCVNLFNKLDTLESDLRKAKTTILKLLENTYLDSTKKRNMLPSDVYKTLQYLLTKDNEDENQPLKKKRCTETMNILKDTQLQNVNLQHNESKKIKKSCEMLIQIVNNKQFDSDTTNTECSNSIRNKENFDQFESIENEHINVFDFLLPKQD